MSVSAEEIDQGLANAGLLRRNRANNKVRCRQLSLRFHFASLLLVQDYNFNYSWNTETTNFIDCGPRTPKQWMCLPGFNSLQTTRVNMRQKRIMTLLLWKTRRYIGNAWNLLCGVTRTLSNHRPNFNTIGAGVAQWRPFINDVILASEAKQNGGRNLSILLKFWL